jgi:hypothetical protein
VTANPRQEKLYSRVGAVWRREQVLSVSAGALGMFRWAIPLFLAAVAIDWMVDLPPLARIVVLIALLSAPAYRAWYAGWRDVRMFDARHAALRAEKYVGGLESLLVTAVQFGSAESPAGVSRSLIDLILRRAEEAVADLRPEQAVRYNGLKRPAQIALVLTAFFGLVALLNGPVLATGAARIFAPWLSVDYPTRTHIAMGSGDMIVKGGGRASIRASVSGVVPEQAKVALRAGSGRARRHSLAVTNGACDYTIESAFRSFEYRIFAGDAKSAWHSVGVIPSPRIEKAEVTLEYPPYTRRPTETVEALTVAVPEGTRIGWKLALDRAVKRAELVLSGDKPLQLETGQDGRTVMLKQVATQSRAYSFSWVEAEHGFSFTSPSHYLQVEPDQAPYVELSSPKRNLYATLGRKIDLAYRGRDDHGIGEVTVAYRVDKTEEKKVQLAPPASEDGGEHGLDWDYRTVLPDLAVGNSVSFVIELADRYPGPNGPHRVRSRARRVSFLSREDYLERIERQKTRLLARLKGIYREQRKVHDVIRSLDPNDDVFVQTCQLEAVRQDLMRERLLALKGRMDDLIEDLAANNIKDEKVSAILVRLGLDLERIANEHVGRAAAGLRILAVASNQAQADRDLDPGPAVHMVDSGARELACLMMQLDFRDAAEAMARELHAAAQAQEFLRMRTLTVGDDTKGKASLSEAQGELAQWLARLFAATPWYKESTSEDAIVAFVLSRLVRKLSTGGADASMREASGLIGRGEADEAARIQAGVIAKLLDAEFRLRVGAEYEALTTARDQIMSLAEKQKELRARSAALTPEQFGKRGPEIARRQAALRSKLHLLLMPAIPAPRPRLFDADVAKPPVIDDLFAAAEDGMQKAAIHITAGDRDSSVKQQLQVEESLEALISIVRDRIEEKTESERLTALRGLGSESATKIGLFEERLLALLEKTEDAAADRAGTAHIAELEEKLADDIAKFRTRIDRANRALETQGKHLAPLLRSLDSAVRSLREAVPSLRRNQSGEAIASQEAALEALAAGGNVLAEQAASVSALSATLDSMFSAQIPGPHVADIEDEQRVLIKAAAKAKPGQLRRLAVAQRNLVHAVNAVLASLDVLADKIDSGTVMLFAKDDMDAAGEALETNDLVEAADAQDAVAEALGELGAKLDAVAPQFSYIFEVTEFLYEVMPEAAVIRGEQQQLRKKTAAAQDGAALGELIAEQRALLKNTKAFGSQLYKATGLRLFNTTAESMGEAVSLLEVGDRSAAVSQMEAVEESLTADGEQSKEGPPEADKSRLLILMTNLASTLVSPTGFAATAKPSAEVELLLDVLAVASAQKSLYRETQAAVPDEMPELAGRHHELEKRLEKFIARSNNHSNLVSAKRFLAEASSHLTASSRDAAVASQRQAVEVLRHFVVEYVLKYVEPPAPPASSESPVETHDVSEDPTFKIFMPGAVSGVKPKSGRQEWEVLGRRDRAALNENFARELPLEYRAILKDYYERLAQ